MSKRKLWFKSKRYGIGWTPSTWEGWLTTISYIAIIYLFAVNSESQLAVGDVKEFFITLAAITAIFIAIAYRTGEKLKWRWGSRKTKKRRSEDRLA